MYMSSADYVPTDADIAALPKIKRDQITLVKFLGSGAFGEVFEGAARNLEETRVAVKTLRKGASPQEKIEFLKEALLMSNFKHEHILRLIGVCLDNNPTLIIMDLMEGRDLLSYLRSHRPTKNDPSCLTLKDLLSLSVDVTKGCKYLEEMHFVHRDLAARNCLVSCLDPAKRIVKIGDFGLARDIYRNDYYKKEGEGLLPVRWMAPECLVDGIFSTQSDAWAFGVLLWEIMSLGQQPYPARTNVDVLHYVRSGGRLNRPANCSHLMYSLMLKCWSFEADKRPSFKYCLQILEYLKSISKPLTLQVDADYAGHQDSSVSPLHTELQFTFPDHSNESIDGSMPGYLELLNMEAYYEIPRPFVPGDHQDVEDINDTISIDIEPVEST
uniref:receptor protein-tyrosine kinase n=2 Tax=Cacopsylla melanoneura TaxID=428564 RepID=A0A8D9DZJ2_9HEMI